jgi:type I restriction enzyme, S subunit
MSIAARTEVVTVATEGDSEVPEGWALARISEIYDSWGGMTPSTSNTSYWGGDIPWISPKDVKSTRIKCGADFITQKALQETRLRMCPAGSVLTVVRSGILANTFPVAITESPVTINQDLKAFWSSEPSLNEWLSIALRGIAPRILEENRKDGTTVQSIRVNQLVSLRLPIPPLAEQKRISETIQQLSTYVVKSGARISRAKRILDHFRKSVLAAAVSGKLTEDWRSRHPESSGRDLLKQMHHSHPEWAGECEAYCTDELSQIPETWAWARVENIGEAITGNTPSKKNAEFFGGSIAFFKPTDLDAGYYVEHYKDSLTATGVLHARVIPPMTVMVTCIGATIGKTGLARISGATNQQINSIITDPHFLLGNWLFFIFSSSWMQGEIKTRASETTLPILNKGRFEKLPLPIPSLEEQHEIVRRVEALFKAADAIEKRVSAASLRAERLTLAILAKAFRGELVPTEAELARREGRTYEPASALLARIKAERATASQNGTRTKTKKTKK